MVAMADESKYPTRIAPYGLRMAPDLKARVQASADANGRSLHQELIQALEKEYPAPKLDPFDAMNAEISRIADTLIFDEGIEIARGVEVMPIIRRATKLWGDAKGPLPINEAAPRVVEFIMRPKGG